MNPSRRELLQGLAATAAVGFSGEAKAERLDGHPELSAAIREYQNLYSQCLREFAELPENYGDPSTWTPTMIDALREELMDMYGDTVQAMLTALRNVVILAWKERPVEIHIDSPYSMLRSVELHGLVYAEIPEVHYHRYIDGMGVLVPGYFSIRASDYLPESSKVLDGEIDPRADDWDHHMLQENGQTRLQEHAGWSAEDRKEIFKHVLADAHIRKMLQGTNCTLAEVYSLIKAFVRQCEKQAKDGSVEYRNIAFQRRRMRELLEQREEFMTKVFLDKETQLISLTYGGQHFQEYQCASQLAEGIGMPEEKHALIQTMENPEFAEEKLTSEIAHSKGETTVFIDSHGYPETMSVAPGVPSISFSSIAISCFDRIINTGNIHSLKDLKFVFTTCYSHDFAENLANEIQVFIRTMRVQRNGETHTIQSLFKLSDEEVRNIELPTIVAAGQDESVGYAGFLLSLIRTLPMFAEAGKITGGFFMRTIQPMLYELADLTFFDGNSGELTEIG